MEREAALRNSVFKPLIDAGAQMFRQDKGEESAHFIMSTLIKDEKPMTLKIQKELKAGRSLGETSAGVVIIEEMAGMGKKHDETMDSLTKEMEEAKRENNEVLRAEIAEERRKLEEMKARAEEDKKRLNGRVTDQSATMGRGQSHSNDVGPSSQRGDEEEQEKTLIRLVFGFVAAVFTFVLIRPFRYVSGRCAGR
jgi:hypothetical protein